MSGGRLFHRQLPDCFRLYNGVVFNVLSHGIKVTTDFSSVLSQCMRLTDRRTEFSSQDCVCIPCSAVKTVLFGLMYGIVYQLNVQILVHLTVLGFHFSTLILVNF